MAQTIDLSFTPDGWQTLINKGFVPTLKYYSFGDNPNLYNISATNNILPKKTGTHVQLTGAYCAKAQYDGILPNPPAPSEISDAKSRLFVYFNSIDCTNEFTQSNLSLRVNINTWLNELNSATYSYNMSESLSQKLWSFISVGLQNLDWTIKDYVTVNTFTNVGLTYIPVTKQDSVNYNLISPKAVRVGSDGTRKLTNVAGQKYSSPFVFSLNTGNINGDFIYGTSGVLSLLPDTWGYWVNGNNFVSIEEVEDADNSLFDSIFPAVQIGNKYYYLPNNTSLNTTNGLVGYTLQMVNVTNNSQTALQALIENSKLFFKANGKVNSTGSYVIPVSFKVTPTNSQINNVSTIVGNIVNLEFSYDPNDTTSPIIQII